MKVLFMGTPEIAATCLAALVDAGHAVCGAVCQPDKPAGRGHRLSPPPVKVYAEAHGIPVYQPQTLKDEAFLPELQSLAPDAIAVVAYGKILPSYVIHYPKYGCVNVHASLLPKYRGAAPMQRAIMAGETETGVTTMMMDEGLDTGDMLLQESFPILREDDFETVHDKTAALGARLLCETLARLESGTVTPTAQGDAKFPYADKITKEDCLLDFTRPAEALFHQIRGLSPVPLAFTHTPDGKLLKVAAAAVAAGSGAPGTVLSLSDKADGGITVACGDGALLLREVLPEGKGRMKAAEFVRGRKLSAGDVLS